MTADAGLARELRALREELAASARERARAPAGPTGSGDDNAAAPSDAPDEETPIAGELRDLVDQITEFAEEAERTVSKHPTASVIGALFLGILIGRLIGKR